MVLYKPDQIKICSENFYLQVKNKFDPPEKGFWYRNAQGNIYIYIAMIFL